MKIGVMADNHLGYAAYTKTLEDGTNVRYDDTHKNFKQAMNIFRQNKIDKIINAGDLFDNPDPDNRSMLLALEEFREMYAIVVEGNHTIPRKLWEISPSGVLSSSHSLRIPGKNKYTIESLGHALIHTLGWCSSPEVFAQNIAKVSVAGLPGPQILVIHGTVVGEGISKPNEMMVPKKMLSELSTRFDFIFLGHWHNFTMLEKNACYVSSTVRQSFAEAGSKKLVLIYDTEAKEIEKHEISDRPMAQIEINFDSGKCIPNIKDWIEGQIGDEAPILKVRVFGVPMSRRSSFIDDYSKVCKDLERKCLHVSREWVSESDSVEVKTGETGKLGSLEEEWESFCKDKEIQELGMQYIQA